MSFHPGKKWNYFGPLLNLTGDIGPNFNLQLHQVVISIDGHFMAVDAQLFEASFKWCTGMVHQNIYQSQITHDIE